LSKHRQASIDLETSAAHVGQQLPNNRTRVTYVMDSIQGCNDYAVHARIENIEGDDSITGKRNNFEAAVTHLLPADPVMENNNKNCRSNNRTVISAATIQSGKGKFGADLRWHPLKEHKSLNDAQRDELKSWRNSNDGKASIAASKKQYLDKKNKSGGGGSSSGNKRQQHGNNNDPRVKFKKMIASVVTDTLQSQAKQQDEEAQINAITANLMSHMKLPPPPPPTTVAPVITAAPSISATSAGPSPQKIAQRLATLMKSAGH
jgi:hypothetical protein